MNISKTILTILATLLFTGCGGTNSAETASNTSENQNDSQTGQQTPGEIDQNISFSASFNDPSGILGAGRLIHYNNVTKSIELTAPFPLAAIMPETSGTLPNHPDISFSTDPVLNTITLSIPISSYIDLVESPTTLPNGRPLPDVNGGEPPSFGFPLNFLSANAYGYAAFDSFSIFVESGLRLPINLAIPIRSEQSNVQIGKIHWLAPTNGEKGGVFISVRLPKELSVILANAQ